MRAPGSNVFAWVIQSFIDELAHAGGRDPYEFRLELLGDKDVMPGTGERGQPYNVARMRNVLKLAAAKAGWGQKQLPKGQGQGIAFHFSHRGYFAEVAEVTVARDGTLKVDRVVAACDVGAQIVNLSGAENQVEGSIVDGLGTALFEELDIDRGRVVQGNFNAYQKIRIDGCAGEGGNPLPQDRLSDHRAGRTGPAAAGSGGLQRHLRRHRQAHPFAPHEQDRPELVLTRRRLSAGGTV